MNFFSFFPPELYEIFLSRAKERWKSFSETSSENNTEGVVIFFNKNFWMKIQLLKTSCDVYHVSGPVEIALYTLSSLMLVTL